jgi:hypothetical protein
MAQARGEMKADRDENPPSFGYLHRLPGRIGLRVDVRTSQRKKGKGRRRRMGHKKQSGKKKKR